MPLAEMPVTRSRGAGKTPVGAADGSGGNLLAERPGEGSADERESTDQQANMENSTPKILWTLRF